MKKIMFNTRYGLEQAVLDGRKTMTRREITNKDALIAIGGDIKGVSTYAQYQVGEVVAIAQAYKDCGYELMGVKIQEKDVHKTNKAGWKNKMFVKASLMKHHIRITNIRVERLQDISDEDCLREGVEEREYDYAVENIGSSLSVRDMFAWLIDKTSSKGTWERNPYVFVYEFELVD